MPRRGPAGEPGIKLVLTIDGQAYEVQPLAPGTIRLEKSGGGRYHVNRTTGGALECDCPDYVHRAASENHVCKHATALSSFGLPIAPAEQLSVVGCQLSVKTS